MTSREYWNKREEEALKHYTKNEQEYQKRLNEIYQSTLDNCQKEIDSFFGKYAAKEGITIAEAKKRVSQLDIKAYERKAEKYVKDKDFSAKANEEMRLYNLTMKVNRLEMLKANIGLELIAGHDELDKYMSGILKGRTMEELQRQAGILGKTVSNAAQKANALVNASFRNANFSDRIWMYQDELKNDIGKLLTSGLIQGKNPRTLAKDLKARFGVSTSNAERLMRTELARVQTEAQKQSYQRNGWGKYEFIVNRGCCPICEALDGKHFSVDKMQAGFNAPPMHPNCRCATAPWEDSEEYDAWLDYLDKGGTTEKWEATDKAIWKSQRRHAKGLEKLEKQEEAKVAEAEKKPIEEAKPASVSEANESGTKMLAEIYENHRTENGLNVVPYSELKDSFGVVGANYGKISAETANAFNETLAELAKEYDSPLQKIRPFTKDEALGGSLAFVRHNYSVDSAELAINPVKCGDFNKMIESVKKTSEKGWSAKIPEENYHKYIATHEFAHTIINLQDPLSKKTNFVNANYDKIKKARKELEAVHERYINEVRSLTERHKKAELEAMTTFDEKTWKEAAALGKELRGVKISNYSLESADEFVAEAFANEKLGTSSNKYAKEVVDILDKYFKR